MKSKKCEPLENLRFVAPGWGCCKCRQYNGKQRPKCKSCKHNRCDIRAAQPLVQKLFSAYLIQRFKYGKPYDLRIYSEAQPTTPIGWSLKLLIIAAAAGPSYQDGYNQLHAWWTSKDSREQRMIVRQAMKASTP